MIYILPSFQKSSAVADGVPDGVRELLVRAGAVPAGEPGAAARGARGGEGARRGGRTPVHGHRRTGTDIDGFCHCFIFHKNYVFT